MLSRTARFIDGLFPQNIYIIIALLFFLFGCNSKKEVAEATYSFVGQALDDIELLPLKDTLHFPLDERTYNRVETFNCFKVDTVTYISFYDRGSKSVNLYNFYSRKLILRKQLGSWVKDVKLDKAAIFYKNFDSIFITTQSALYLLDSSGVVRKKIKFQNGSDKQGFLENTAPLVLHNELVYLGIKPFIDYKSIKAQKKWKVLYELNTEKKSVSFTYSLPDIYHRNLYGYPFLEYGYCLNDNGNFVFSFAADTNIYETNLANYHVAYLGRSKFQNDDIEPVDKEEFRKQDTYKLYSLRYSYGGIFFDPYMKRYLRLAKQKLNEAEFKSRKNKKRSIIIFNEQFRIIGESEINGEFSFDSILFIDGNIYARTNWKDETALHFVRLIYKETH